MIYLAAIWLGILLFKLIFTLRMMKRGTQAGCGVPQATATILQPVLSGDPQLATVLEANVVALKQARFFWLIDDDDTVAREIAISIQSRYPDREIKASYFPQRLKGLILKFSSSNRPGGRWRVTSYWYWTTMRFCQQSLSGRY